jgi:hypothetical protein
MKKQFLIISVMLLIATFIKSASAQIEVCTNNNVKIGAATTSTANLTIAGQYGEPGNSNLSIGIWGSSSLSLGVHADYSWVQSFGSKPLIINKSGNNVLFFNGVSWGNVGIGYQGGYNWAPSAKLHVIGNILASGTVTWSDERIKNDIVKFTTDKTKFKSIEAKTYNMDTSSPRFGLDGKETGKLAKIEQAFFDRKHFGFLAQDVQKVYPELVYEDNEGYLAVDYQGFIPILYETVKEQQAIIDDLLKRLEALEKKGK